MKSQTMTIIHLLPLLLMNMQQSGNRTMVASHILTMFPMPRQQTSMSRKDSQSPRQPSRLLPHVRPSSCNAVIAYAILSDIVSSEATRHHDGMSHYTFVLPMAAASLCNSSATNVR